MRLAPSLHRLGEEAVDRHLLVESGEVTLIDAGVPAYYSDLAAELAAMGRTIEDIRALVLTHGHGRDSRCPWSGYRASVPVEGVMAPAGSSPTSPRPGRWRRFSCS